MKGLNCPACNKSYKSEKCEIFLKRSVKERSELGRSKGLCFFAFAQRTCGQTVQGNDQMSDLKNLMQQFLTSNLKEITKKKRTMKMNVKD